LWTAYEVYELWKEFNKEEESNKKPTKVEEASVTTDAMGNVTSAPDTPSKTTQTSTASATATTPSQVTKPSGVNGAIRMTKEQGDMAHLIFKRFREAGFSEDQANGAVANAWAESRLKADAKLVTDKEASYGLFQMNTKGGLGTGHDPAKLQDPEYNISLAIEAAKKSKGFTSAKSLEAATIAFTKEVERPANAEAESLKRVQMAGALLNRDVSLPSTPETSAPSTTLAGLTGGKGGGMESLAGAAMPAASGLITAMTTDLSDITRALSKEVGNITNVTNNNVAANKQSAAPQGPLPSVYDDQFLQLLAKVS